MIIVMLGAPGAGKGTQARRLAEQRGMRHISTGDLLRDAVAQGTELGRRADEYMSGGRLVPDQVVLGLVEEVLEDDAAGDVILDGFPRTVPQAEGLDELLSRRDLSLGCVVYIDITMEEAVRRLSSRVSCVDCGAVYNLSWKPPKKEGVCDKCGGRLARRADDEPEAIERRFREYEDATAPLTDYYRSQDVLRTVHVTGTSEDVPTQVDGIIDTACGVREAG